MKLLWICALPEEVRVAKSLSPVPGAAMSWIMGHLPPPDGVELHIVCPAVGLNREYEVGSREFAWRGAHWHLVEKKRFEPLWGYRRLARQVKRIVDEVQPDVVHGWGGEVGCGLVATMVAARAVVSVQGLLRMLGRVVSCQSLVASSEERGFKYWLRERLEARAYRRAKVCLCESETAREALKRLYGVDGVVVPQPLREEFIQPCRSVEGEKREGTRFLFVGQDVPRKGIQDVRDAFLQLPTSTRLKSTLTVITGGKSAVEIAELMRTHDVFVLPSYGDTGPTAIKEALAMGMRVIAYDNTGPKELLERYGGVLVKTGDVAALARAMGNIKPCRGVEMENGESAANRIRKDLSRETVWSRLLEVYGRVVSF